MIEGVTFCNQNVTKVQVTDEPAARLRREHTRGVTFCNQNMTNVQVIGKNNVLSNAVAVPDGTNP